MIHPLVHHTVLKPHCFDRNDEQITLSVLGHSTVLINFFGTWILTDPVLFDKVGLEIGKWKFGPQRYTPPALTLDEIPQIDIILLSHAHMDHLDHESLGALSQKFPQCAIVTPANVSKFIKHISFSQVKELDRNEKIFFDKCKIQALEVHHRGARIPRRHHDRSKGHLEKGSSYNGYLIEKNGKKIVFWWDTAYTDAFKRIAPEYPDVALMPIGAYKKFKDHHCDPMESLQMTQEMNAKIFIPIHFGTFKLSEEPIDEPIRWLKFLIEKTDLILGLEQIGQTFILE